MSDISGLISQYGFEFQKIVFIYYLVSKMAISVKISYELLDDLDLSKEELGGIKFDKHLIQCKTGNLQYATFKHVICNWILSDDVKKYSLYLDEKLAFSYSTDKLCDDIQNDSITYVNNPNKTPKTPRKDCFKYKVYNEYNGFSNQQDIDMMKQKIKYIVDHLEIIDIDIDELENETKKLYIATYGADATVNCVKNSRYDMFVNTIREELTDSILKKKPYTIDHNRYCQICLETVNCISDHHYSIEYFKFKKGKEDIYKKLLSTREAIFLQKINKDDRSIARFLTSELYYKDLREHYIGISMDDMIDDIEENAFFNYSNEKSRGLSSADTFINTIDISINDSILLNNQYRHGCYIFLSSDSAKDDYFIDWCGENEKK